MDLEGISRAKAIVSPTLVVRAMMSSVISDLNQLQQASATPMSPSVPVEVTNYQSKALMHQLGECPVTDC